MEPHLTGRSGRYEVKQARPVRIIGLNAHVEYPRIFWAGLGELGPATAAKLGLGAACPDLGTALCLGCELGMARALEVCDFACSACEYRTNCPCSLSAWRGRQGEEQG